MSVSDDSEISQVYPSRPERDTSWKKQNVLAMACVGIGGALFLNSKSNRTDPDQFKLLKAIGKASAGVAVASFTRKRWRILCMNARVANSAAAIEDWIFHWICLVNNNGSDVGDHYRQLVAPRKVSLSRGLG